MKLVRDVLHDLMGLFVDDGRFAAAIIFIIVLALMFAAVEAPLPVTGTILFVGCLLVLAWSVLSADKR